MTHLTEEQIQRRLERWLFVLVFIGAAWFHNGANWNQISRLDMVFSFVEPGTPDSFTFHIDRFMVDPMNGNNTGDWACDPNWNHHYFSNKAPGTALMMIPAYGLIYLIGSLLSVNFGAELTTILVAYLLNLIVTVLPLALAVPVFVRLMRRLGASLERSVFLGLALFPGSLMWPFGTQLWGHVTGGACMVLALYFLVKADDRRSLICCGLWGGLGVLNDYSCAIAVMGMGIYLLFSCQRRQLIWYLLGGLLPLAIYVLYHYSSFGSAIKPANLFNNPRFREDQDLLGILHEWRFQVWWGLTFSRDRGIFWFMPVLLPILPALAWLRPRREHSLYWMAAGVCLGFFLMNVTFNGWHGGGSTGPRYLIPAIPFAILLLNLLPEWRWWRYPGYALLALSSANMLVIAATCPMIPYLPKYYNPLPALYKSIAYGWLHLFHLPTLRPHAGPPDLIRRFATINIGELFGLHGALSIVPLLLIMGALLYAIFREIRRTPAEPATNPSADLTSPESDL